MNAYYAYKGRMPDIDASVFIADGCRIIGDVTIAKNSSVWFNAVIRADIQPVRIGEGSNIQDNAVIHVGEHEPCVIGSGVTVGHQAVLHGCTVEDGALIGIGAIVLTGAVIGKGAVVAAGAVVTEGMKIPERAFAAGIPAEIKRILDPHDTHIRTWAEEYCALAQEYKNS